MGRGEFARSQGTGRVGDRFRSHLPEILEQGLPLASKQKALIANQDIGSGAVDRAAIDVGTIHRDLQKRNSLGVVRKTGRITIR